MAVGPGGPILPDPQRGEQDEHHRPHKTGAHFDVSQILLLELLHESGLLKLLKMTE